MKVTDLNKDDWQELVEKINDESCILLLGPNLYKDHEKNVLQNLLYEKISDRHKSKLYDFFPEDGFFVPMDEKIVNDMRRLVKNFYKEDYPDEILKKIAQIPFHCIVTLTPDMLMKRCFDNCGIEVQFERFSMTQPVNPDLEEASIDKPLLYNIFGSIDEDETIILTHNDFFNYLKNIIGDERLPVQLRRAINKATDLLFIGFSFEKWWIQLMMRLLGLHVFPGEKRWAIQGTKQNSFSKINEKQFDIKFIEDDSQSFIDELFEQFSKNPDSLRKLNTSAQEAAAVEMEISNKRIAELKEQIVKAMDLVNDYEKKRMLSDEPKEIERCNSEINNLNEEIKTKSAELQSLKH